MKSKIFGLMVLSILATVMLFGFASAAFVPITFSDSITLGQTSVTVNFKLNNTGAVDYTNLVWSGTSSQGIWTSLPTSTTTLISGQITTTLSATLTGIPSNFAGNIIANIHVNDSGTSPTDLPVTIRVIAPLEVSTCLQNQDIGDTMELEIEGITVTKGLSEDDNEWVPLDEVEIELRVENTDNDYKLEDIAIGWGLYDLVLEEFVFDDEESDFTLKDGEEDTIFLTFKLEDPDDFQDSDYAFFVWAQGEDEESNLQVCQAVSEDIDVIIETDFLVLDNFEIEGIELDEDNTYPDTLSCESTFQVTADLWNIGDSDQEDIQVRVYNSDFGIDEYLEIGDINEFDSEPVSFLLTIPNGLDEKFYQIEFTVYEDNDAFENDYTDEDAEFNILLDIEGNCMTAQASVSASLESGGKAGRELVVVATITNTGNTQATYTLNAAGYSTWASEAFVELGTLTLEAGQSADIFLTFDVKSGVSGDNTFNLEVLSENELVISQPISVPIQKSFVGDLLGKSPLNGTLVIGIAVIFLIIVLVFLVKFLRR